MEGLKKRTYIFAALLIAAGAFNFATYSRAERPDKDESWMEARAPEKVNDMTFARDPQNPQQSYRMNDQTYSMLAPFGIVSRVYSNNESGFDVVLIASESRASFHDPRICFSGQGWALVEQRTVDVKTRTRGTVPVTITKMDGPKRGQLAAFFYRGPSGFHATTIAVKLDMFKQRLLNRADVEGVFYRFIPSKEECTEEELKAFIVEYLEASKESSEGYF
ncbi:MAG TPA: exosortase-associated EpsI family protein [Fimbriimonadaceae bacterium]|nr:exosortase-associated EpsI family protein [Fimbriimonadaceae bacterium]